jgi:hypothetical protein
MRQDQYEKLQAMSEKLTDVFLAEADPDNWPGSGWNPQQLTKEQRGDRYWSKKNAIATLSVITKITQLTGVIQESSAAGVGAANVTEDEDGLDAEIRQAEKEAAKLLDGLQRASAKKAFDKRVHGKG